MFEIIGVIILVALIIKLGIIRVLAIALIIGVIGSIFLAIASSYFGREQDEINNRVVSELRQPTVNIEICKSLTNDERWDYMTRQAFPEKASIADRCHMHHW